jgi:hypothetical protein
MVGSLTGNQESATGNKKFENGTTNYTTDETRAAAGIAAVRVVILEARKK